MKPKTRLIATTFGCALIGTLVGYGCSREQAPESVQSEPFDYSRPGHPPYPAGHPELWKPKYVYPPLPAGVK